MSFFCRSNFLIVIKNDITIHVNVYELFLPGQCLYMVFKISKNFICKCIIVHICIKT